MNPSGMTSAIGVLPGNAHAGTLCSCRSRRAHLDFEDALLRVPVLHHRHVAVLQVLRFVRATAGVCHEQHVVMHQLRVPLESCRHVPSNDPLRDCRTGIGMMEDRTRKTDARYPGCRRQSPKALNSPLFLWTTRGLSIFCSGSWRLVHVVTVVAAVARAKPMPPSPTTTNGAQVAGWA